MGVINKYFITISGENYDKYRKEVSYKGKSFVKHETVNKAKGTFAFDETEYTTNLDKRRVEWEDDTVDYLETQLVPIPSYPGEKQRFDYKFDFYMDKDEILREESEIKFEIQNEDNFIEELFKFNKKYNIKDYIAELSEEEIEVFGLCFDNIKMINGQFKKKDFFFLYPVIQKSLDYDREIEA